MTIVSYEFEYDFLSGQSSFSPVKSTRITSLHMTQKILFIYTSNYIYFLVKKLKLF